MVTDAESGRFRVRMRSMMAIVALAAVASAFPRAAGSAAMVAAFAYLALAMVAAIDATLAILLRRDRPVGSHPFRWPLVPLRLLDTRRQARVRGRAGTATLVVAVACVMVPLYAAWMNIGLQFALSDTFSLTSFGPNQTLQYCIPRWLRGNIARPEQWRDCAIWEAWSLARWLAIFSVPAVLGAFFARERISGALHRLLVFSPWLVVLDLGMLFFVWLCNTMSTYVPEPYTMFANSAEWWFMREEAFGVRFWLIRCMPTGFVVGFAFARGVMRWRWSFSAIGAVFVAVVATAICPAWNSVYLAFIGRAG